MSWPALFSEFVVGVVGTLVGVVLGLMVDRARTRRAARDADRRLLQSVVDRLAGKRAFSGSAMVGPVDDPEDRRRCVASVLDARERIARARDGIINRDEVVDLLDQMEADATAFLDHVDANPLDYARALIMLRERLHQHEHALAGITPGLRVITPGSRRSVAAPWLDLS